MEYISQPRVSFITVNFNGARDSMNLLQTIFEHIKSFCFEVIVIDNASIINEFEVIKQRYPFIKGEYLQENLGFAGGNNRGLEMATGDYMYFINNDTLLPKDADSQIQSMISFCEVNPEVGGLSPKILYHIPPNLIQFAGSTPLTAITMRNKQIGYKEMDLGQYNQIVQIPYFHGAAMFVPKTVINHIGRMPTCYFLYYEELDWSNSITKHFQLFYFPLAQIVHLESASTGIDSPLKVFYITRNRVIFAYRQRKGSLRVLALSYLILIAFPMNLCLLLFKLKFKQSVAMIKGIWSACRWIIIGSR
ncbi:glycosyltransferase family 2 protein [Sphingobacterium sp. UGAL515B_05]|uniref:glycosyltransferase family 2 protein n=1 Tax=Sphingobacterium sp. UGAL515B_05 TaxID=2986767 RepID=UPI0029558F33|nr:glycosyltransferase family 2 protein [Sphingobacterium sp. UGAL515B_05]WON96070.1 glycosyltransferase family 2 protein [Sphingobacterium sp. UGAL515B_05]